jgi:scyllo-inositol 2-dehydrogenase (NAD+)
MSAQKSKLNCGVIGLGRLGYRHAMSIARNSGARLVAAADPVKEARDRALQDFEDVKVYEDYRDMLEDENIQGIVVATPTKYHYEVLMDVINAGKDIFVEKPITYTVEEAESVCNEIDKKGNYLQVAFMRRFDPGHVAAKKMIESGEIGDPIYVHDCQRDPNGPPKHYVPESGGLYVDMGIHDLDCTRWLMNSEIVKIYSHGAVLKHEYLKEMGDVDEGQMLLTFDTGALGMIEVSRNANDIYDVRTEIIGTKGSVYIGQTQLTPYIKVNANGTTYDMANWCLERFEKAYELEVDAFVNAVREGKESPVNARDGMIALKLAKAATDSYRKGQAVELSY